MDATLMNVVNRPMIDVDAVTNAKEIGFYSDASAARKLGFGCILGNKWTFRAWEPGFIKEYSPSIKYLELFAVCAGLFTWQKELTLSNKCVLLHCDNMAVVSMINTMSSGCAHCMHLIRLITLNGLKYNRRLRAIYVKSKSNFLADALSRLKINRFKKLAAPSMQEKPDPVSSEIRPLSHVWLNGIELIG